MSIMLIVLLALLQQNDAALLESTRAFVPGIAAPASLPPHASVVRAINALAAKGIPVSADRATQYATAILKASRTYGIDPYLLVAVARVESGFTGAVRRDYRCTTPGYTSCSQDCGVTQQNFTGHPRWVLARCRQVRSNPEESFMLAAEELAKHTVWCREKAHLDRTPERCILNRYNGGPYYRRAEQCRKAWACEQLPPEHRGRCLASKRRCLIVASYWTKVLCFQEGARTAQTPTRNCNWCWSVEAIPQHFETK